MDDDDDDDGVETCLACANRFFDGLLAGDLNEMQSVCAPGSVLWINLTEQERALEASLPGFARLRGRVPDLRMEAVRRRGVPGGFVEQHVLTGTLPSGDPLRVVGCFLGTVANGSIVRLEEYVDGGQAGALSALLKST
jgi:ketosteroid isomerase-like protein